MVIHSDQTMRSAAPHDPHAPGGEAIALVGGTIVELFPARVETADVLIVRDRIVQIGGELPRGVTRVDARGCVITPAFVNAHTHLYMSLTRGMPSFNNNKPMTFVDWMTRVWWKVDKALDEELVRVSALTGAVEAARAGVATVFDHHSSPRIIENSLDLVAQALDEVGVRGVLCYDTSDRDGRGRRDGGLKENERWLARTRKGELRHRGMVGAHASFTLNDDTLDALKDLAERMEVGIHIHVAEDPNDEKDAERKKGSPLVDRLERLGVGRKGSIVAQAVHLAEDDAKAFMKAGAYVVTNPRSNMISAVGVAPATGERVAIGTDGFGADVLAEAQAYFLRHSEAKDGLASDAVKRLVAGQLLAAQLFGEEGAGKIERGMRADIAVLAYDPVTPMNDANVELHALLGWSAACMRHTIVGGRFVLRDGRVVCIDEDKLRADARTAAGRLWERMHGYL